MTEAGERGGASSARQRPSSQRSTNRESDDRRVKHPANERQDDRDRKAESELSRDKRREETRLSSAEGDSIRNDRDQKSQRSYRDHPQTHREGGGSSRGHPQSLKEYRGYRSERRDPHRDQKTVTRDQRPPRESKMRDRRSDIQGDEVRDEVGMRSGKKSEDHTTSKQTSRAEDKPSRGTEVQDKAEKAKDDGSIGTDTADKHGSPSAKQRVRYKVGGLDTRWSFVIQGRTWSVINDGWSSPLIHVSLVLYCGLVT